MINKVINIMIIAAAVVLTASCGIYKKYERPENVVGDDLFGQEYATTDTVSIADLGWRELFTDSHLQALIEKGLESNTDVRTAMLSVEKAETALKTARLAYLPSFNFAPEGSVGGFNNFNNLNTGASWTYTVPVAASWEVDIFGKNTNRKRQAKESLEMAKNYEQAAQAGLIAGIATQYYTLLMLDEQLRIAESTAEKFKESVRVLSAMSDAGMANEVAVAQMKGAWYQIEAAKEEICHSISDLETAICTVLFETPHHIERGVLSDASFPEELLTGVPVAILSRRPDVRAAENNLAASYYAVNVARASLYPSLSLSGAAGWTNSLGSTVVNPSGLILNAAASILQPIFNSRALKAQVEIARADQEAAELSFRQTVLNAGAEVNNALRQYQCATEKAQMRSKQVEALKEAVTKTELLMQHSSTTYLDVLTAEQSLLSAETSQAEDTYERISAVITLYHALGG
ncbi:MAG: efflux transporter outer membrane subunit, partial [Candidatus Cryptobacteroides sp.]